MVITHFMHVSWKSCNRECVGKMSCRGQYHTKFNKNNLLIWVILHDFAVLVYCKCASKCQSKLNLFIPFCMELVKTSWACFQNSDCRQELLHCRYSTVWRHSTQRCVDMWRTMKSHKPQSLTFEFSLLNENCALMSFTSETIQQCCIFCLCLSLIS